MTPRILLLGIHFTPTAIERHADHLRAAGIPCDAYAAPIAGPVSSAYARAADAALRKYGSVIGGLMIEAGVPRDAQYDIVIPVVWSAGYGAIRVALDRGEWPQALVLLDAYHASETNGQIHRPHVDSLIRYAASARTGSRVLAWLETDIDPIAYASTSEVGALLRREVPPNDHVIYLDAHGTTKRDHIEARDGDDPQGAAFTLRAVRAYLGEQAPITPAWTYHGAVAEHVAKTGAYPGHDAGCPESGTPYEESRCHCGPAPQSTGATATPTESAPPPAPTSVPVPVLPVWVTAALAEVGVREGDERVGDYYACLHDTGGGNWSGQAWCAVFLYAVCFWKGVQLKKTPRVATLIEWAKKRGIWREAFEGPRVGWLPCWTRNGGMHVGVCHVANDDRSFRAIEGNKARLPTDAPDDTRDGVRDVPHPAGETHLVGWIDVFALVG